LQIAPINAIDARLKPKQLAWNCTRHWCRYAFRRRQQCWSVGRLFCWRRICGIVTTSAFRCDRTAAFRLGSSTIFCGWPGGLVAAFAREP